MMRTYTTTVLLMMISVMACMAEDAVYLRNGSVIKGRIEEYAVKGDSVNIKTERGLLNFSMSEIDRLVVGDEAMSYGNAKAPSQKSKYRWMAEVHSGWVFTENDAAIGLTTTHGIEATPHLFIGGGMGVIGAIAGDVSYLAVPFFGEVRTYAGGKKAAFTAGLRAGGGLDTYVGITYYAHIDLGVRFAIKDDLCLSFTPYVDICLYCASFGMKVAVGTF